MPPPTDVPVRRDDTPTTGPQAAAELRGPVLPNLSIGDDGPIASAVLAATESLAIKARGLQAACERTFIAYVSAQEVSAEEAKQVVAELMAKARGTVATTGAEGVPRPAADIEFDVLSNVVNSAMWIMLQSPEVDAVKAREILHAGFSGTDKKGPRQERLLEPDQLVLHRGLGQD